MKLILNLRTNQAGSGSGRKNMLHNNRTFSISINKVYATSQQTQFNKDASYMVGLIH